MSIYSKASVAVTVALVVIGVSRPLTVTAQSLADVAKQEEERRGAVKAPAKVLTNKDLTPVPVIPEQQAGTPEDAFNKTAAGAKPPAPAPAPATAPAAPSAEAKPADGAPAPGAAAAPAVKDQAYWSEQRKALDAQLSRDQIFMEAMQTRVNSLTADFANRDDPAQRAAINTDRQKAVTELARLKDAIEKDKKAIADFQEQARREGVPPGWLR